MGTYLYCKIEVEFLSEHIYEKTYIIRNRIGFAVCTCTCDYNEDNFPGFDEKETITDVSTDTLVLADAHYGKIASMPKNQGIALAKDPEGQTYLTALNQLGKTKMFTDMVAPEDYLPAFVDSLYAYLSDGSKVLVQYNIGKEQPEYLSKINEAQTFDLTSDNYATVWGKAW